MIKTEPRKGGFKVFGSGGGGKSGGSSRTPVETPDSLHNISYAAILDVISNGEVYGQRIQASHFVISISMEHQSKTKMGH
uniref:hypothetical protein n=1 Tax=Vibrio cholerae TaxID=666 RepID=UPI003F582936